MSKHEGVLKSYTLGLVYAVILTVGSFYAVTRHLFETRTLYIVLTVIIVLQLFVQVVFFMRLNGRDEQSKWDLIAFLFTILIGVIVVSGSLWIMYNLNYNMMS